MSVPPAPPSLGVRAWVLLLLLSLLWGGSFFFAELALHDMPALLVAWGRVASGALFLLLFLRLAGSELPSGWRRWRRYATMGLLNNALPFSLIFLGQSSIGANAAAILNATTPCFAVLLAHWTAPDERLTARRLGGVTLGAAGVGLLVGLEALSGLETQAGPALLVLLGALSYACAGLYGRRFRGEPPLATACGQVCCSTLWLLPAMLAERPWSLPAPSLDSLAAVLALGLLSTALAYRLYFRILALAGATNLLLVTLLIPPSAMALSALFLGKPVGLSEAAGFVVIALGLLLLDGRAFRAARPAVRPRSP
jgi:drug/metabolite transporter (DMT)-like permease